MKLANLPDKLKSVKLFLLAKINVYRVSYVFWSCLIIDLFVQRGDKFFIHVRLISILKENLVVAMKNMFI